MPADLLTPLAVYLKMSANAANSFLLESVEGGRSLARYSFIGAEPEMVVRGGDKRIEIREGDSSQFVDVGLFEYLREHFAVRSAVSDPDLPAFVGGAIGYLGFDCCEWFEPTLKKGDGQGNAAFMFFRSIVAFDHAKQVIKIISLVFTGEADDAGAIERLVETANERNRKIQTILETGQPILPKAEKQLTSDAVVSNWQRPDFESAVTEIKELINAGECYQVVISQCFTRPSNASPVAIYRALRSLNPSPYMFLLQFEDKAIVGASPEMLVRCENRRLEYRPIAGTRPRGTNAAEDDALAEEMRLDKKEVAEHKMLVDLAATISAAWPNTAASRSIL